MVRSASQQVPSTGRPANAMAQHRRTPTTPISAPTSPAAMQGGFRRTAAPDPAPAIAELAAESTGDQTVTSTPASQAQARPNHASSPPSHRHSMHVSPSASPPFSDAVPVTITAASPTDDTPASYTAPMSPSGHTSSGFVRRFGSILGRGGQSDDGKKHSRNRNSMSVIQTTPTKERPSTAGTLTRMQEDTQDPEVALTASPQSSGAAKGVTRSSTTGAELSPANRSHARGVSIDTASPTAAARVADAGTTPSNAYEGGPPLADRRRQTSMSVAHRRPKTTGSVAPDAPLQEVNENVPPVEFYHQEPIDPNVASDLKPVYLKVRLDQS